MKKYKPELLAPAGNMKCLHSAINAGADAVYLSYKEFGARASADNFTLDELVYAIELSHLHDVKVYLTMNILLKEREWNRIEKLIVPLYKVGLDGVIVQDLGLIDYLKMICPDIHIHASTQMTITGPMAARLLKERGVERIVPARELSLEEITHIKDSVDIQIEAFVHGAMCYSYSGQCLFSSFLGGRSGNRGRCAGPCRLPYTVCDGNRYIKKDSITYPISLKDMCTIECIDKLIDARIDSFKIEGRLKSPEYVAGVTSIYRKYIDEYMHTGQLVVETEDLNILNKLYIRSEISRGYYYDHNGDFMITKTSPSYNNDEAISMAIRDKFGGDVKRLVVTGIVTLVPGENMNIILHYKDHVITCEGQMVEYANNRPLTIDDVRKQLTKTGDAFFCFDELEIIMEDNCFMQVKRLNELRREAFELLKKDILYG